MMVHIDLTASQLAQLEPLFEAVREANRRDGAAAIGAQIYMDAMVCRVFVDEKYKALATALGGNTESFHYCAEDRLSDLPNV